jgi:hypothetical protein
MRGRRQQIITKPEIGGEEREEWRDGGIVKQA